MVSENTSNTDFELNEFIEPRNPTDPIVVFDPEYEFSQIILPFVPQSDEVATPNNTLPDKDPLKIAAVKIPLIKVNNRLIFSEYIIFMSIKLKNFLPEIKIIVNDINGTIQSTDVPGMNNVITVIITAPVNGSNKKISLDFYIDECIFNEDRTVVYTGKFKMPELLKVRYSQIGDKQLTTYEMFEAIAKDCKLGFAATEKCKDITDSKWRQLYSQSYVDYINNELEFAGLDEDSIFDAWIDTFGYIVMVNLPYVMTEKVDSKQLSIKVIHAETNTMNKNEAPEQNVHEVYRVISNSNAFSESTNMFISDYNSVVDNENIKTKGTNNVYWYMTSPCDENTINTKNIVTTEPSVDGLVGAEEYKFENIEFIGTLQNEDDLNSLIQKEIITNYKNSIYAKTLVVELDSANYSLQRGMLINVSIDDFKSMNKSAILENGSNVNEIEESEEILNDGSTETDPETTMDMNNGVTNPSLSGMYYIKDVEFLYRKGYEIVKQKLTLVKKGILNNLSNKYTSPYVP